MRRAFEFRKAKKPKRWDNMARVFTKLGGEVAIVAKQGRSESENNPRLRVLMQDVKKENTPEENVGRTIRRAVSKNFMDYKETNYKGYGPFGIAIFVETAMDNTTRTVASVRSYSNKNGSSLGTSGGLEFLFDHKYVFHIARKEDLSLENLELELINFGVDGVKEDEDEVAFYGEFAQNPMTREYLEENGSEILSSEPVCIPNDLKKVTPGQREFIERIIEKLEEDEDAQNVLHNMKEDSSEEE